MSASPTHRPARIQVSGFDPVQALGSAYGDDTDRASRTSTPRRPTLENIAATLAARGLKPLIDRDMHLVVALCPECGDGENPRHIWRPLRVIPRHGRLLIACACCGREQTV